MAVFSGCRSGSNFSPQATAFRRLVRQGGDVELPPQKARHVKKIKQVVEPVNQQGLTVRRFQRHFPLLQASEVAPVGHGGRKGRRGVFKELREALAPDLPGHIGGMGQLPILGGAGADWSPPVSSL